MGTSRLCGGPCRGRPQQGRVSAHSVGLRQCLWFTLLGSFFAVRCGGITVLTYSAWANLGPIDKSQALLALALASATWVSRGTTEQPRSLWDPGTAVAYAGHGLLCSMRLDRGCSGLCVGPPSAVALSAPPAAGLGVRHGRSSCPLSVSKDPATSGTVDCYGAPYRHPYSLGGAPTAAMAYVAGALEEHSRGTASLSAAACTTGTPLGERAALDCGASASALWVAETPTGSASHGSAQGAPP
jgi:hypothetical protein